MKTSKFLFGTEQGIAVSWNRKTKKSDKIERAYLGHHSSVYTVQRNPFFNKYFLSVGDWTVRIWNDELKYPIMETNYHSSLLTTGAWSSSRAGVFSVGTLSGHLEVWDLSHNNHHPLVNQHISDAGVSYISEYAGKYLIVGTFDGCIHYVELSDDLSEVVEAEPTKGSGLSAGGMAGTAAAGAATGEAGALGAAPTLVLDSGQSKGKGTGKEEQLVLQMLEREFKREKVLFFLFCFEFFLDFLNLLFFKDIISKEVEEEKNKQKEKKNEKDKEKQMKLKAKEDENKQIEQTNEFSRIMTEFEQDITKK